MAFSCKINEIIIMKTVTELKLFRSVAVFRTYIRHMDWKGEVVFLSGFQLNLDVVFNRRKQSTFFELKTRQDLVHAILVCIPNRVLSNSFERSSSTIPFLLVIQPKRLNCSFPHPRFRLKLILPLLKF